MSDSLAGRVGFIGLGAMGWSLAGHLHRHGSLSVVGNRSAEKTGRFTADAAGVARAAQVADFAACAVVVLCVSADADVLENVRALAGVLAPGSVVVDHDGTFVCRLWKEIKVGIRFSPSEQVCLECN